MVFEVIGKVRGKQRPRFSHGHTYTPRQTTDYEKEIRSGFIKANGKPLNGPTIVQISIFKQLPKRATKKKKNEMVGQWCQAKPDIDNVAKIVMDALNGTAYHDDSQVVQLTIQKRWTLEEEKIIIEVKENGTDTQLISNDSLVYSQLP